MPPTISVTLPRGNENWCPDLFPGSDVAAESGCLCPVSQPWPGAFVFAINCPVHELERKLDS